MTYGIWVGSHQVDLDRLSAEEKNRLLHDLTVAKQAASGSHPDLDDALCQRQKTYADAYKDIAGVGDDLLGYRGDASFNANVAMGLGGLKVYKGGVDAGAGIAELFPGTPAEKIAKVYKEADKFASAGGEFLAGHADKAAWKLTEALAPKPFGFEGSEGMDKAVKGALDFTESLYYANEKGDALKSSAEALKGAKSALEFVTHESGVLSKGSGLVGGLLDAFRTSRDGLSDIGTAMDEKQRLNNLIDHAIDGAANQADRMKDRANQVDLLRDMLNLGKDMSTDSAIEALKAHGAVVDADQFQRDSASLMHEISSQEPNSLQLSPLGGAPTTEGDGIGALADQAEKHADHTDASDQKSQDSAHGAEQSAQDAATHEQRGLASSQESQDHADGAQQAEAKSQESAEQAGSHAADAQEGNTQADGHAQTASQHLADATDQSQQAGEQGQAAEQHAGETQTHADQSQAAQGQADGHHSEAETARGAAEQHGQTAQQSAEATDEAHGQADQLLTQIGDTAQGCGTACDEADSHQNQAEQAANEAE